MDRVFNKLSIPVYAGILLAGSLVWGMLNLGGSTPRIAYQMFFLAAAAAFLVALKPQRRLWSDAAFLATLAVGVYLLIRMALADGIQASGYLTLVLGWLAFFVAANLLSHFPQSVGLMLGMVVMLGWGEAVYGLGASFLSSGGESNLAAGMERVSGTYFNRNHYAALLNMGLLSGLGLLVLGASRRHLPKSASERLGRQWLSLLFLSPIAAALVLSGSRGGVAAALASIGLMIVLALRRRRGYERPADRTSALALCLVLIAGGVVAWAAVDYVLAGNGPVDSDLELRLPAYSGTLRMIADAPLAGVGPGMFVWRFRPYQSSNGDSIYVHAHNDYLQSAAEWGIPLAAFFWGAIVLLFFALIRDFLSSRSNKGALVAVVGVSFGFLVHSLVDFNLQIPANSALFFVVLAIGLHLIRERRDWLKLEAAGRFVFLFSLAAALAIAGAGWSVAYRYLGLQALASSPGMDGVRQALRWDPGDPDHRFRAGVHYRDDLEHWDSAAAVHELEQAVRLNPYNWRYQMELGRAYELTRRIEEAEAHYRLACRLNNLSADYRWRLAGFYIRQGRIDPGVTALKESVRLDRRLLPNAFQLLERVGRFESDYSRLLPEQEVGLAAFEFLLTRAQPRAHTDLLSKIWPTLIRGGTGVPPSLGDLYVRHFLDQGRAQEARKAWIELSRSGGFADREFEAGRNLVWQGELDTRPVQGSLGWRMEAGPGFSIRLSRRESPGDGCLELRFQNYQKSGFQEVEQTLVAEPGLYLLSFEAQTDLEPAEGLFLTLSLADSGELLHRSQEINDNPHWRRFEAQVKVPEEGPLLRLRLNRRVSEPGGPISGVFRLDSVRLQRVDG